MLGVVYRSSRRIMYVNAGLKGRGNHGRIILRGRRPRCGGLKAGRGDGIGTLFQYSLS